MDEQSLAFHRQVRAGYLAMAAQAPQRWLVMDAAQPVERIHQLIVERITPVLRQRQTFGQ